MGHKGAPVLLLYSAQCLSLTSRTRFKGTKTTGNTAVGTGLKQGQGTRREDTTPDFFPTSLPQPGRKREGRIVA